MKPLNYRSMSSKGAGRPRLMHHHKGGWNEMKWMRWVWRNGGMKFVVGENGRNPVKNLPRPRSVHHETHMEGPRRELGTPAVGGERLTACATRPPDTYIRVIFRWFSRWRRQARWHQLTGGNLVHNRPADIIWPSYTIKKIFIRIWMAMVSDLCCSTRLSLK